MPYLLLKAAEEIERLQCSELAWKIIAKQNKRWNDLPQTEKEATLDKALTAEVGAGVDKDNTIERLVNALERCRTVLGNMALENEGAIFNRWPIGHEPLRADAKGLLPVIEAALPTSDQTVKP